MTVPILVWNNARAAFGKQGLEIIPYSDGKKFKVRIFSVSSSTNTIQWVSKPSQEFPLNLLDELDENGLKDLVFKYLILSNFES
jgi:hypothetical protein